MWHEQNKCSGAPVATPLSLSQFMNRTFNTSVKVVGLSQSIVSRLRLLTPHAVTFVYTFGLKYLQTAYL